MAKQQDLPLNPMEISGICGRLLCCLSYENEFYAEAKRRFPKVGKMVDTPQGRGRVISLNIFTETMRIELENEILTEISCDELLGEGAAASPGAASGESKKTSQAQDKQASKSAEDQSEGKGQRKRRRSESSRSRRNRNRRKKPSTQGSAQS